MKVYILISQKPFSVKTYSSLVALMEDNDLNEIGASRSTLEKHDFRKFNYINSRHIIALSEPQSSGDIRRKKMAKQHSI
ncbi:hypothetical protein [Dysgonomonas sp. 520]|uniref:hypothetical protein n=1 Tax=Dysgonomonas sp. 520 TaxID=2302931 RepID=UPI0013D68A13|nr:hypothetical protein [Dysgonomonas sp. 520]NDW10486.1 hypothetical protein [Dysgonomonas sp. 520]